MLLQLLQVVSCAGGATRVPGEVPGHEHVILAHDVIEGEDLPVTLVYVTLTSLTPSPRLVYKGQVTRLGVLFVLCTLHITKF